MGEATVEAAEIEMAAHRTMSRRRLSQSRGRNMATHISETNEHMIEPYRR
jgi:hypothetical protein